MEGASSACHGMHDVGNQTRNCFLTQTCKHLVHLTKPILRPATISCSGTLLHSSSGARFRGTEWTCWDIARPCAG